MATPATEKTKNLSKSSIDCSLLLTHLVRADSEERKAKAKDVLKSILGLNGTVGPLLRAAPTGWAANLDSLSVFDASSKEWVPNTTELLKSICFTESTLAGLKAHRDIYGAKYGIAFDRDYLLSRGANPCLNIRQSLLQTQIESREIIEGAAAIRRRKIYNFIPIQLMPFVNIINNNFDATPEREWRHVGDLDFSADDAFFLFCPEAEFEEFGLIKASGSKRPVMFDLAWLDRI